MNKELLNTDIQLFIKNNLNTDISSLLLRKQIFPKVSQQELVEQIEAKKRGQKKLPTWFNTEGIYYPNKLNIEQTSSEQTAEYKSQLVTGNSLIDITGGFGIDCFFFSKIIDKVTHCEINENLSKIVSHNCEKLGIKNIQPIATNGIEYLRKTQRLFDWIYIDPSRRNDAKGKVFLLNDCLPNVPEHLDLLFEKANHILIKTSPLLDISNGIRELSNVKEIHIIAVKNEVKELLYILEKEYSGSISIQTANIKKDKIDTFKFESNKNITADYSLPKKFLYEPNAAILKSGAFNEIATTYKLNKLHQHSHLYTSDDIIDFPGRSFKIIEVMPYNKKTLKKRFGKQQLNITTRNFPKSVAQIRKETLINEGGNKYLFFTTDTLNNKIAIYCEKI